MEKAKVAKLTIVGAGPGDVDLITIKAVKALQDADVILYDALVNEELLTHATHAEVIFVGKRLGCHAYSQDQINELIVVMAKKHGHVVRLKGGDPFVFGRGGEETAYAEEHGLETAIVPGISSALGVPTANGIALTQRKVSDSFWVITGTTANHKLSKDVDLASKSSATVVILMGMHKLKEIVSLYQSNRTDNLPVAIIQNGTTSQQKMLIGTVDSIEAMVQEHQLTSPAIIIIGAVVKNPTKLSALYSEATLSAGAVFQNLNEKK